MIDLQPGGVPARSDGGPAVSTRGNWIEATVVQSMNDHGGMVVQTTDGTTLHLVEYALDDVYESLRALRPGDEVTLRVERLEGRGSCWCATGVVGSASRDPKA